MHQELIPQQNLLNLNRSSLANFLASIGESPQRAAVLTKWIHQRKVTNFNQMQNLKQALRVKLQAYSTIQVPQLLQEQLSVDGTYKWLLRLRDGNAIETVFIPELNRGTLCVSSQAGCSLNCSFCATAQAGFNRNLSLDEIIGQVWWASFRLGQISDQEQASLIIKNVVMMGMGEPLLNYSAVVAAMELMLDDFAYGLSKYRVTLSTAGLVPAMQRLRQESPVSLAVSLHAPNNTLRSQLVPLNKKYPLEVLMPICRDYFPETSKQKILFEYVMLAQVNDQKGHAQELANLLQGIRCKVNLIPFNPFPGSQFNCSHSDSIEYFQEYLTSQGIPTWVRRTRGGILQLLVVN